MRKESERRYQSVDQLADDIVRYLDGRSVRARQNSFGYRAQKFVGRQRSPILAITTCLIALPLSSEALSQSSPDWMPSGDALIYSRVYGAGDPGLYRFDLRTGQSEKIPGSDGLYGPRWSPDVVTCLRLRPPTICCYSSTSGPANEPHWSVRRGGRLGQRIRSISISIECG